MKKILALLVGLTLSLAPFARADAVVTFNEIMYHPATNEAALEWVELHNQLAVDVDVSDWSIRGAIDYFFPSNSIVRGGGFVVVALSPGTLRTNTGLADIYGPFTGRLGNNGDHIELRNNSGRVMDDVTYGVEDAWPVAADGAGVSLAKRDPNSASGPGANWYSSSQVGGTPGAANFPRTDIFVPPQGLVSYWKFDEAGAQAGDQAGQNTGTLGGGVARSSGSLVFDGTSNAFVNFGPGTAQSSFAASVGVTIEMAIRPNWNGSTTAVLFAKAPARPGSYPSTVLGSQPVAYWRLNDVSTTISDSTANARNGTASAGVLLSQPSLIPSEPANAAARFGNTDRIIVNGFEKIGAAGYTVEYWVKVNTLPAGCCQNLVGDGEASGDYFMMNYILGPAQGLTGAIRPHYGPANSPVSMATGTALQVGNTYHIVTTWNTALASDNAVIYVNGVANTTGTITRNVPGAGTTGANRVYIGKDDRDTSDGNNTIDEVALYNYPLTAADVANHYAAGITTDFDLNLGNAIQLAFQNDGQNAQANPPVAPGPVLSFGLVVNGVYSELDMPLDGQEGRPTLAALQDGTTHHLAATYNSVTGVKAILVDGVVRFSTALTGLVSSANNANAVAGNSAASGNSPYTGTLDDLAFWGKALSTSDLLAHANAVQAGYDYFSPTSQVVNARLAFNELSTSTNGEFWVELMNIGTNPVPLEGFVLYHDGETNNAYEFPAGSPVAPGEFLTVSSTTLGSLPTSGDKLYLYGPERTNVFDGVVVKKRGRGRSPDGIGEWLDPSAPTAGASNSFVFRDEIVINEIMYRHARVAATNDLPSQESREQWIELFNRSTNTVDLTGWEITGGVDYQFPTNKTIAPGAYLVVTENITYLKALYPTIDMVGDFQGRLSGKSSRIVLRDPAGNPADEVRYYDSGKWPKHADGGGSSLELRDPNADNSTAESWAASDETDKTGWQTYTYRMVAGIPSGSGQPTQWNDFVMGLLDGGECLIDDISVIESPSGTPVQFIANGNFESGLTGWRVLGTHGDSTVVTEPGNPGNHVLRVIATGPQEHMHNHIETTYTSSRTVVNGREYQISYRAKWLAGNNLLNTRLYFNRAPRTMTLPIPTLTGTPGAQNSRYEANTGPTFSQFAHQPIIPPPGEAVTVTVQATDPQGVASCAVWWSANSGAWANAPMTLSGGRYLGTIPGQAAGTVVQFLVRAVDGLGLAATFPAGGTNSGALYAVSDGQANLPLAHNVRIIMTPANTDLMHGTAQGSNQTNVMSNDLFPCTVVYDEQRAYYDCGVHLRGSQRGRYSDTRTGFHINFQPDDLFRGVHPVMLIDRSGAGDATANRQEEIVLKHMLNRAGGIPGTYSEICRVIAPRSAHTGPAQFFPRHEDLLIESAFNNGGDGTMFEMELIYYPTTANAAGYKNPQPDTVIGTDITNLGDDKEIYRYNFMIKNHREVDDYAPFVALAKSWSLTGAALDAQTRELMDVDQWMRAYALVSLCAVGDMYTFGNNHNFFMYVRPSDGKFLYFPWDMDFVFSRGATAALVGDQNLAKVVNLPGNLRRMYAHMLDIIGTSFNTGYMTYWTDHYDNFAPGQSYAGSLANIGSRATYARNTILAATGTNFTVNPSNAVTSSSNMIVFSGTAPVQVTTIKVNGVEYPITWTSVSAWTLRLTVSSPTNELNIVGYDLRGNALSNYSRTVTVNYTGTSQEAPGNVVLSEIMYRPAVSNAAYLELQNLSTNYAFDLAGWRIEELGYEFPFGAVLAPRSYLVLAQDATAFAAAYGSSVSVYASLGRSFDPAGQTVSLVQPGTNPTSVVIVDKVRYEPNAPWPASANGQGAALQLIDGRVDNARVSDWSDGFGWRYFRQTGSVQTTATNFLIWMGQAGDVYIDDVMLVVGSEAEVGPNLLQNAGFENPLTDSWKFLGTNLINSTTSTDFAHSGQSSLHVVSTGAGSQVRAIAQTITPPATNNTPHTLSYWYRTSVNGTNLVVRTFGGSGMNTTVNFRPLAATPGTTNSVAAQLPAYPPVWLNEAQASNTSGPTDRFGEHDAWIELHNSSADPLPLDGFYLSDSYANLAQWQFPAGAAIPAGGFLVVWADGQPGQSDATEYHASFALTPTSGSVALSRLLEGQPQIIDYLNYAGLGADQSYGDYPDGQPFERRVFDQATPGAANTLPPVTVFINEWMANNSPGLAGLPDPADGRYDDWIELFNAGAEPADLSGLFLTDNLANRTQWRIPDGTVIPPSGFLLIWADDEVVQNGTGTHGDLHASFKLERNGEAIGLFALVGTNIVQIDAVTFGSQFNNASEGRYPDAASARQFMATPTPRASNLSGNTRPAFSAVPVQTAFVGQPFSLAIPASDPDVPPQTLRYDLVGAPPTGATLDPTNALFQWTPTATYASTTNLITVRVDDNGTPSLTASISFAVLVTDELRLGSISQMPSGEVTFTVGVTVGKTYRLEFKDDLGAAEWTPAGPDQVAESNPLTFILDTSASPQRFYRIIQVD